MQDQRNNVQAAASSLVASAAALILALPGQCRRLDAVSVGACANQYNVHPYHFCPGRRRIQT